MILFIIVHLYVSLPGASSLIAEWPRPSWGAGADPVHGVAHPPHAPALLVATLAVPTVRALVLALNNGSHVITVWYASRGVSQKSFRLMS